MTLNDQPVNKSMREFASVKLVREAQPTGMIDESIITALCIASLVLGGLPKIGFLLQIDDAEAARISQDIDRAVEAIEKENQAATAPKAQQVEPTDYTIKTSHHGVQFTIGAQTFTIDGTQPDPEEPDRQQFFVDMLKIALNQISAPQLDTAPEVAEAETLTPSGKQALGLYALQADEIKELLNKYAPETIGSIKMRVEQVLSTPKANQAVEAMSDAYPYYELKFIMRVLGHAGKAPEADWKTAYGMARQIFLEWHVLNTTPKAPCRMLTEAEIKQTYRSCSGIPSSGDFISKFCEVNHLELKAAP